MASYPIILLVLYLLTLTYPAWTLPVHVVDGTTVSIVFLASALFVL